MNRKRMGILAAGGAAVAITAGIGVGTFAKFTHTETSDSTTATAKKLYLNENLALADLSAASVAPGETILNQNFTLTNAGDMAGDLMITLKADGDGDGVCTEPEDAVEGGATDTCDSASELLGYLKVAITPTVADSGAVTAYSLDAMSCTGETCTATATVTGLAGQDAADINVHVEVKDTGTTGADNVIQGDAAKLTLSATLAQQ
ncbi:MAG: hypothetical protein HKP61_10260 [Dactylosporangium sp.]|nr:hypothetical protein [Dactylosporangium sp.]NNJ61314.1 hypothetical protein [Dactylosporangium sp.]